MGLRRGTFNCILGHAGQRKSALARTIAYNAAMTKKRVLYIPLESTFDEELTYFALIHAQNPTCFGGTADFSIKRFDECDFTEEEEKFLRNAIVPDLKETIGDNLIIRQLADTTWENVKSVIELENFLRPLDLIVIDYVTIMDVSQYRDHVVAYTQIAKQLKLTAQNLKNGRGGAAILTPLQGSRKGYEEAQANDGAWEKTGVYMYSEMYNSADLVMYTYMPIELQNSGELKIGTCKSRKSADMPAQLVPINLLNSYIGVYPGADEDADEPAPSFGMLASELKGLYDHEVLK